MTTCFVGRKRQAWNIARSLSDRNLFCGLRADSARTANNFMTGMLCSLPIMHVQRNLAKPDPSVKRAMLGSGFARLRATVIKLTKDYYWSCGGAVNVSKTCERL